MGGRKRIGYVLLLVMVTSVGLLGCVEEGPQGETGAPGPTGQSGEVIIVTNPSEPSAPLPPDVGLTTRQAQPRVSFDPADVPAGVPQVDIVTDSLSRVRVAFRLTDDNGDPIDRSVLSDLRFILAHLDIDPVTGLTRWLSTIFRTQTSVTTGLSVQQPNDETNGTLESLGNGVYRYTLATPLPDAYDPTQTYRIGIEVRRRVGDRQFVDNNTLDFRPDGNPDLLSREVVQTANCQNCHEPFAFHGGIRTEVKVCVQCHTVQNADPDTLDPIPNNPANFHFDPSNPSQALPNPLDFDIMIHRIHQGKALLDEDAITYQVIGFGNNVNDYSEVVFPQDIRNCTTCHTGTTEADHYKTSPSRNVCGSCHIRTWFGDAAATPATLENHVGGPQDDDTQCTTCHTAEGANEFDISVRGAHTNPQRSVQAPGVNFAIIRVEDADDGDQTVNPGHHARVVFNLKDNAGNPILPSSMAVLSLTLAGPTTDYRLQDYDGDGIKSPAEYNTQISARGADGPDADGNFSSTFTDTAIPQDALGTFAVGMEGYQCATIVGLDQAKGGRNCTPGNTAFDQIRDVGHNVVAYVAVTDAAPVSRHIVVDSATTCIACHGVFSKDFSIHGGLRNNTEYCVLCHTPATDTLERQPAPAVGTTAATSPVHFKYMIHAIHRGENLSQDYLLYAFAGGVINVRDLLYPGDLRNCQKCHVTVDGDRTELLIAGQGVLGNDVQPTINRRIDDNKDVLETFETPPIKSACVACHDTAAARAHAELNTTPAGEETCSVCHGDGKEFAVDVVHAR